MPGIAHHVTQRGVRRQNVFFNSDDRRLYLSLLQDNAHRYGVEIVSYCLMTNHVHLLLVPLEADSLRWTLQFTHKRYADYTNRGYRWSGHLWQEKFYSSPLDERYFWIALRYIERNPLSANLVKHPADYPWSSAAAHCGKQEDSLLTKSEEWLSRKAKIKDWSSWLMKEDKVNQISQLRKNTARDLPTGSESFYDYIEESLGVSARPTKLGRPRKKEKS